MAIAKAAGCELGAIRALCRTLSIVRATSAPSTEAKRRSSSPWAAFSPITIPATVTPISSSGGSEISA